MGPKDLLTSWICCITHASSVQHCGPSFNRETKEALEHSRINEWNPTSTQNWRARKMAWAILHMQFPPIASGSHRLAKTSPVASRTTTPISIRTHAASTSVELFKCDILSTLINNFSAVESFYSAFLITKFSRIHEWGSWLVHKTLGVN